MFRLGDKSVARFEKNQHQFTIQANLVGGEQSLAHGTLKSNNILNYKQLPVAVFNDVFSSPKVYNIDCEPLRHQQPNLNNRRFFQRNKPLKKTFGPQTMTLGGTSVMPSIQRSTTTKSKTLAG